MKDLIFSLYILFLFPTIVTAQPNFNLSFDVVTNNGSIYEVDIIMSFTSAGNLGSGNLVFSFNTSSLNSPTLISHNLGSGYAGVTVTNPKPDECWFNFGLNNVNSGIPISTSSGTNLAKIRFNVSNPSGNSNLQWLYDGVNLDKTIVFLDDEATLLSPGILTNENTSPLPIELLSFQAKIQNTNTLITWRTASETQNAHFLVQHSTDGRTFQDLAQIPGKGNSQQENNYEYLHESPSPGTNYYRLKQVDFDGQFEYSKIISIEIPNERPHLTITPNPNAGQFTLSIQNPEKAPITARLTDSWRRVVWVFSEETDLPEVQIRVEPEVPLPGGIYSLVIFVGRHQLTERVAIQRP